MIGRHKGAFLIIFCPLYICLSVCQSVFKLFTFQLNFAQRGIQVYWNEGPFYLSMGDIFEWLKIHGIFYARAIKWPEFIVLPSCRHYVIIHFLIINSTTDAHIQLKFNIWICLMNLVLVWYFLTEMCLLNFEKMRNSQSRLSNFWRDTLIKMIFNM